MARRRAQSVVVVVAVVAMSISLSIASLLLLHNRLPVDVSETAGDQPIFTGRKMVRSSLGFQSTVTAATAGIKSQPIFTGRQIVRSSLDFQSTVAAAKVGNKPFTAKGGRRKLFECGWPQYKMLDMLFPDLDRAGRLDDDNSTNTAVAIATEQDILIFSGLPAAMTRFSPCYKDFPGATLAMNGESSGAGRVFTAYGPDKKRIPTHPETYSGLQSLIGLYEPEQYNWILQHDMKRINTGERYMFYLVSRCYEHRETAFVRLSALGRSPAYYGGGCSGNDGNVTATMIDAARIEQAPLDEDIPRRRTKAQAGWIDNHEIFNRYRFCLVMENRYKEGYLTEKIINAFLGGCIPIYYGTRKVFDIFNKNSFIFYDVNNPQPALDLVAYLEKNDKAYQDMLREPILAEKRSTILEKYFSYDDSIGNGSLKHQIRQMLGLK